MSWNRLTSLVLSLTLCFFTNPVRASHATTTVLAFGDRAGLLVIVETACMSAGAVLLLFGYMAAKTFFSKQTYRPVRESMGVYLISLLVGDLVQSAGAMMSSRWVNNGLVEEGAFCTTQGVIQTLGEDVVALSALVIAAHTFATICLNYKDRRWVPWVVVGIVWTTVALFVGIGYAAAHTADYYGDAGLWCWITPDFLGQQIGLEYVWMWITAFVNLVVYIPIYLCLRSGKSLGALLKSAGNFQRNNAQPDTFDLDSKTCRFIFSQPAPETDLAEDTRSMMVDLRMGGTAILKGAVARTSTGVEDGKYIDLELTASLGEWRKVVARNVLWFPLWYFVQVFPLAVARFNYFRGHALPTGATVFGSILFYASGLVNVLLCVFARHILFAGTDSASQGGPAPDITVTFNGDRIDTKLADEEEADGQIFLSPAGAPSAPRPPQVAMLNMRQRPLVGGTRMGNTEDYSEAGPSERRARTTISAFEPTWERDGRSQWQNEPDVV